MERFETTARRYFVARKGGRLIVHLWAKTPQALAGLLPRYEVARQAVVGGECLGANVDYKVWDPSQVWVGKVWVRIRVELGRTCPQAFQTAAELSFRNRLPGRRSRVLIAIHADELIIGRPPHVQPFDRRLLFAPTLRERVVLRQRPREGFLEMVLYFRQHDLVESIRRIVGAAPYVSTTTSATATAHAPAVSPTGENVGHDAARMQSECSRNIDWEKGGRRR